ncbi:hypothetical protein COO60DRAFT_307908 [Scenedesmus sp. NREL 46B-D3]|nr:hypothetical protein COO60DRAFT_307908 [Scenedesmus sp. NREL 46B-D3]
MRMCSWPYAELTPSLSVRLCQEGSVSYACVAAGVYCTSCCKACCAQLAPLSWVCCGLAVLLLPGVPPGGGGSSACTSCSSLAGLFRCRWPTCMQKHTTSQITCQKQQQQSVKKFLRMQSNTTAAVTSCDSASSRAVCKHIRRLHLHIPAFTHTVCQVQQP